MYDLNLIRIRFHQGQPISDNSGFSAVTPPRRATRSRAEDLLIMALNISDPTLIPPAIQQAWLEHLVQSFYKTGGTVTAALRALIETLNLTLLEKNLKFAREGAGVEGTVTLAAVHRRYLYLAQCGPTHAYVLNHAGLEHYTDTSLTDRGLGVSRTPTIRYFQGEIGESAYFFTTDTPLTSWTAERLIPDGFPGFDQVRRRLLNQASGEFQMGLAEIVPGIGKVTVLPFGQDASPSARRTPPEPEVNAPAPVGDVPAILPDADREGEHEDVSQPDQLSEVESVDRESTQAMRYEPESGSPERALTGPQEDQPKPEKSSPLPVESPVIRQRPLSNLRSSSEPDRPAREEREAGAAARATLNRQKAELEEKSLRGMAAALAWLRQVQESVDTFFKDLRARWSPEGETGTPQWSSGSLIAIAIAVPLVVVGLAAGVYLARGRNQQQAYFYDQAVIYAEAATLTNDPVAARVTWEQALSFVTQAEAYRTSDETSQLRRQAEGALDLLDGALRLDYRPALIGALSSGIEITRIVSFNADLYLLDKAGGRVIHAARKTQGYEVNPDFVCSSGSFEGGAADALVDMVALPINNPYQAHVLAVDARGNAVYCAAGQKPIVIPLPQAAGEVGEITAITYNSGYLYALNPSVGSVRVYQAINGQFAEPPTDFFEGVMPPEKPDLAQIVDLAANGPELVLLHGDGKMVDCISSGLPSDPVNCENPVNTVDGRPGLEDQPLVMPTAVYSAVLFTDPPDPSVSVLDATNADIYRFSLRFRLNKRLRPSLGNYELENPMPTAFTIAIDRVVFIAFGHQVFFAYVQ